MQNTDNLKEFTGDIRGGNPKRWIHIIPLLLVGKIIVSHWRFLLLQRNFERSEVSGDSIRQT